MRVWGVWGVRGVRVGGGRGREEVEYEWWVEGREGEEREMGAAGDWSSCGGVVLDVGP